MLWQKKLVILLIFSSILFSVRGITSIPSGGVYPPDFTLQDGDWYDSWGFNRNFYGDTNGYMPNIAYESLGSNKERAYVLGEWFRTNYPQKVQRATAILRYVQRWTDYGFDADNIFMNNIPQPEWAWNADEMAHMFDEATNSIAIGDCEDMAFLCSTIYMAANIDAAMILAPQHASLLIWLPEYENANYYWDIPDDGREYGWIWVEATGEQNPLGWTPPDFANGDWIAYPLGFSTFDVSYSPQNPQPEDAVIVSASIVSARTSVKEVRLDYSINQVDYEMLMIFSGSRYETIIPKQAAGTKVTGQVSAMDNDGLTRERRFEYLVGQNFQLSSIPFEVIILVGIISIIIVFIVVLLARSR